MTKSYPREFKNQSRTNGKVDQVPLPDSFFFLNRFADEKTFGSEGAAEGGVGEFRRARAFRRIEAEAVNQGSPQNGL